MALSTDDINFIHCTLQEAVNGNIDASMIDASLGLLEDAREETMAADAIARSLAGSED